MQCSAEGVKVLNSQFIGPVGVLNQTNNLSSWTAAQSCKLESQYTKLECQYSRLEGYSGRLEGQPAKLGAH